MRQHLYCFINRNLIQDFEQAVAADDSLAFDGIDFTDSTVDGRRNRRFHLHGFGNNQGFALLTFWPLKRGR